MDVLLETSLLMLISLIAGYRQAEITVSKCPGGFLYVVEYTNTEITCIQDNEHEIVTWLFFHGYEKISIGKCVPNKSCVVTNDDWPEYFPLRLIRDSARETRLTIGNTTHVFDNKTVVCAVRSTSAACRLIFLSPSATAPIITGYSEGTPLFAGEMLQMRCEINDSKSLVTRVHFACEMRYADENDTVQGQIISSSLILNVTLGDDGLKCTCRAVWVVPDFSTMTDSRQLIVLSKLQEGSHISKAALGSGIGAAFLMIILINVTLWILLQKRRRTDGVNSAPVQRIAEDQSREPYIDAQSPYEELHVPDIGLRSYYVQMDLAIDASGNRTVNFPNVGDVSEPSNYYLNIDE